MSILCKLGKHDFQPKKAFITNILDKAGGRTIDYDESWTGFQCIRCKKKKIVKNMNNYQSVGAAEQAYDWVNSIDVPENPTMLKLIQK